MSIKKLIESYAPYNLSANQHFVKGLSIQSEVQLQEDVPSSFNGVLKTLNHIWLLKKYDVPIYLKMKISLIGKVIQNLQPQEVFNGILNRSIICSLTLTRRVKLVKKTCLYLSYLKSFRFLTCHNFAKLNQYTVENEKYIKFSDD